MKINHIALKVKNLVKCEKFYADVLGLKLIARHTKRNGEPRSAWFDLDGAILMLETFEGKIKHEPPKTSGWHIVALNIPKESRSDWIEKLEKNTIKIIRESEYSLYFNDPEGNPIALSHYPEK